MKHETINEVARAAPPLGVGGLSLYGIPLNEWVLLLTAIYTIFLIVDKFPSVIERIRALVRWVKGRNVKSE
jgi:hypothetical protein